MGRVWGFRLTIHVVPGQVLEGLIKQDDRQRYLEHHYPLAPTQGGHLENKLGGGEVWLREGPLVSPRSTCLTHRGYSGLITSKTKRLLEVPPPDLCPLFPLPEVPSPALTQGPNPVGPVEVAGTLHWGRAQWFSWPGPRTLPRTRSLVSTSSAPQV